MLSYKLDFSYCIIVIMPGLAATLIECYHYLINSSGNSAPYSKS